MVETHCELSVESNLTDGYRAINENKSVRKRINQGNFIVKENEDGEMVIAEDHSLLRSCFTKEGIIFRNNDNGKINWDLVIMILSLFNSFTVPVEMAFEPEFLKNYTLTTINFMIDFCFFVDILICFRTVYINDRGEEVTNGWQMAKVYLKSTFIIDFLATVPFDTILRASPAYINYVEEA